MSGMHAHSDPHTRSLGVCWKAMVRSIGFHITTSSRWCHCTVTIRLTTNDMNAFWSGKLSFAGDEPSRSRPPGKSGASREWNAPWTCDPPCCWRAVLSPAHIWHCVIVRPCVRSTCWIKSWIWPATTSLPSSGLVDQATGNTSIVFSPLRHAFWKDLKQHGLFAYLPAKGNGMGGRAAPTS